MNFIQIFAPGHQYSLKMTFNNALLFKKEKLYNSMYDVNKRQQNVLKNDIK